jgi:hypothetical protein
VRALLEPLRLHGRWDPTLVAACLLLNALVLLNACLHDPTVGYDATQHIKYIVTLSEGRLPGRADTGEFFSPPLPYLLPAALLRTSLVSWWGAAKSAQLLNSLLSLGITLLLLRLCEDLAPGDRILKVGALLILGLLPVYFKSLSFVRGEPYVAFFTLLVVSRAVSAFASRKLGVPWGLGVFLGLLVLSRQWGIFVILALVLFVGILAFREGRLRLVGSLFLSLLVGAVLALPFYAHLSRGAGSPAAFNRLPRSHFSLSNQESRFYLGLGLDTLFSDPVRPAFRNELLPIFYSEVWGDYWEFFLIYARDRETGRFLSGKALESAASLTGAPPGIETNRASMGAYLGRVNLVSLLPTLVLAAGLFYGLRALCRFALRSPPTTPDAGFALLALTILLSAAGYLAFLVAFPEPERGDTIKATYLLHVFPLLAVLSGAAQAEFLRLWPRFKLVFLGAWAAVFLHTLPALLTRHF